MRSYLFATVVLFFSITCGDLTQMDEQRLRNFVQLAKKVAIDELKKDNNSQAEIDKAIDIVVDVLGGDSTSSKPACFETGRKTVAMFRNTSDAYNRICETTRLALLAEL